MARVLQCAEAHPLTFAEAATLDSLTPCQHLPAQFIRVFVALASPDDIWLRCHAKRSREVPLRPAGDVERKPATGNRTQARSEHLDRLRRRNPARRLCPDSCHSLPVRVKHMNSCIISTANVPRTRCHVARRVQVISLSLLMAGSSSGAFPRTGTRLAGPASDSSPPTTRWMPLRC